MEHRTVSVNNYAAGQLAANYLLGMGHRKFGVTKNISTNQVTQERIQGFSEAIQQCVEETEVFELSPDEGEMGSEWGA